MKGANRVKQLTVAAGTDIACKLAKQYKLARWFTPAEVLRMATSANAELLALSRPRNPYPGKLGVIEEGALADLLIVNGDPLKDIALIADPDRNFIVNNERRRGIQEHYSADQGQLKQRLVATGLRGFWTTLDSLEAKRTHTVF
ncbi:hypothetical protein MTYM_00449 [Methylococcales bacterium]|nr:hypothetical protein MTYM_00449 [Methylococcales bacterium]